MTFEQAYKQLNNEQRLAVDTIDGPVMVIAGPGTGKTQLLALRAANILHKTDTLPQNILCLTYTEVGALNMRERISSFIGQAAYDIKISTYHGLGSEIIRENSEYFLEYGDSQPIDKIGQYQIMHDIYAKLPATNILWRPEVYLKDALSTISEAKRANLNPDDLRQIAKNNNLYINSNNKLITESMQGISRISKNVVTNFEQLFIKLQKNLKTKKLPANISMLGELLVTSLAISLKEFDSTGKTNSITKWKNDWLAKDRHNQWIISGSKESEKLQGLADIYEKYNAELIKRNLFDYDDMILRAVTGLEQNDDLRYSLQEKYQYIMLDEFQDTNLSQLKLIELLTNNPVSEGRPNVLAVGDDDQAIFSFQGADLTNMLRFRGMYKDIQIISLKENWRSHKDILTFASNISDQIDDRLHKTLGFNNKELIAKNINIVDSIIERHNFNSDVAELAWIANQVKKEIAKGIPPSEIAIIAPKHKYLEPMVKYLSNIGIHIRYDKRENIFEDQHILDLINISNLVIALSANDHQTANSLWPIVLSSKQWQIPTSVIWQLSWQANKNARDTDGDWQWQALMMDNIELRPIALFFAKLAMIADSTTLETMFDYIIGVNPLEIGELEIPEYRSPYFEYYFSKAARESEVDEFQQLLSNLTVLRQHLRDYKKNDENALKLNDFIEFYTAYSQAGEKLLNTSPYHGSQNSIQLLTAYGAKGLEFEVVFVIATLDDAWGMKARSNTNKVSLPANLSIIKRVGQTKDERKRLFFVAISRAKHTIYLTSHSQNYSGKNMTGLEFMSEQTEGDVIKSLSLPAGKQETLSTDYEPPTIESLQSFWHTSHLEGLNDPRLQELLKPKLENFRLSATDLNHFTDLIYGGPESFLLNKILKFPKGPSADGQYGNAMHETLQTTLNIFKKEGELPDTDQIQAIFAKKLKAKKMSTDDYVRQLEKGELALRYFIPEWWTNFDKNAEAEYSFRDEGCFVGDAHLSGNLDQLLIDSQSKTLEIIDFKTGKPHSKWNRSDAKLHKYWQQLLFYKILASSSHSFKNYDVIKGRLVFVEPNEDKLIDELSVNYTDENEELARTTKLINAVWNCVINLDFPDVSNFDKSAKGIKAFEDWLIANKI